MFLKSLFSSMILIGCTEQPKSADNETVSLDRGRKIYAQYCLQCHLDSGEGMKGRFPPLAGSEWVEMDSSVAIRIILHGLQGDIEVRGQTYSNVMAPWAGLLNDAEIASVTSYIRNSWGNNFSMVSVSEVKAIRERYPDQKAWTAPQLQQP